MGPAATSTDTPSATARGNWLLAVAVLCWGCTPRATAAAAPYADPLTLTTLRALPAAIVLIAAVVVLGGRLPRGASQWSGTAVSGVLMVTVFLAAFTEAVIRAGPAPAIVLGSTSPFFVAAAELALFRTRIPLRTGAGILIGFAGVMIVVSAQNGADGGRRDRVIGLVLALVAAGGWAAGTLVVRRMAERAPDVEMLGLTAGQYTIGGTLLLVMSLATDRGGDVAWTQPRLWLALAFISIVGSALATVAYLSALRVVDATHASTWMFMAPVIAVVLDAALGHRPEGVVLAGMALTIGGVAMASWSPVVQAVRADTTLERRSPS